MIEFIKSLPKPVIILACVIIYIIIGAIVSYIAGRIEDGDDLLVVGALWIIVVPLAMILGICWLFVALYRLGQQANKTKRSDDPLHYFDDEKE